MSTTVASAVQEQARERPMVSPDDVMLTELHRLIGYEIKFAKTARIGGRIDASDRALRIARRYLADAERIVLEAV